MFRARLASLALALGFLFTLSGCCAFCEDGKLFPRLFHHGSRHGVFSGHRGECECQGGAHMPPIMGSAQHSGPIFTGSTGPIPITNIPVTQVPNTFKVPNANPTPYSPTN
ncbi:MAG: hypothetical protein EXR98_14510 [Gemmataceae bacterium]|nr:hypothetical protein [Gemmataceae bacterium]